MNQVFKPVRFAAGPFCVWVRGLDTKLDEVTAAVTRIEVDEVPLVGWRPVRAWEAICTPKGSKPGEADRYILWAMAEVRKLMAEREEKKE